MPLNNKWTIDMLYCKNISKSYGGVQALQEINLSFPDEGIIAIIGPNGAGKTTLLNVLTGFLFPDAGEAYFKNKRITGLKPFQVARLGIARTFQNLRLVRNVPTKENVLLAFPHQEGEEFISALIGRGKQKEIDNNRKALHLLEYVGLEDKSSMQAGELSYGEQKLLSLACCLAMDARVLLLDEPVSGVHPEKASQILDLLRQIRREKKLIVFIEHDIKAVREIADSVIVMDTGKIIAYGAPSVELEKPEIINAYIE